MPQPENENGPLSFCSEPGALTIEASADAGADGKEKLPRFSMVAYTGGAMRIAGFEWDETQEGWADTFFDWNFDHGSFPVASIEIWLARDANGFVYELVATVPSTTGTYRHAPASQYEDFLYYKLRYVDGGTVGPFSSEVEVNIQR